MTAELLDPDVDRFTAQIIEFWKERGFDYHPDGPPLVNGLPSGIHTVTPRTGNMVLPKRIGLNQLRSFDHKRFRAARERIRQEAQAHADVVVRQHLSKIEMDLSEILESVRQEIKQSRPLKFKKASLVIDEVAKLYGYTKSEIIGRQRTASISAARQHIYVVLNEQLEISLADIARLMGRDHTTILSGIRRHKSKQEKNNDEAPDG